MALAPIRLSDLAERIVLGPDQKIFLHMLSMDGLLGPDAYFYFRYIGEDARDLDAFIPEELMFEPYRELRKSSKAWRECGHRLEHAYLEWRSRNRFKAWIASLHACATIENQFLEVMDAASARLHHHNGFQDWSLQARRRLDLNATRHREALAVLRRSAKRAMSDLSDVTATGFPGLYEVYMMYFDRERPPEIVPKVDRKAVRDQRAAFKRSMRFLSDLIGPSQVRQFVSEAVMTLPGREFDYVLHHSSIHNFGHGSCRVTLRTKDTQQHIAGLCLYTPDVPLLDHVASIALHVEADEAHLIASGNLYDINFKMVDEFSLLPKATLDQYAIERGWVLEGAEAQAAMENMHAQINRATAALLGDDSLDDIEEVELGAPTTCLDLSGYYRIRDATDAVFRELVPELELLKAHMRSIIIEPLAYPRMAQTLHIREA